MASIEHSQQHSKAENWKKELELTLQSLTLHQVEEICLLQDATFKPPDQTLQVTIVHIKIKLCEAHCSNCSRHCAAPLSCILVLLKLKVSANKALGDILGEWMILSVCVVHNLSQSFVGHCSFLP